MTNVETKIMEAVNEYNDIFRGEADVEVDFNSILIHDSKIWEIREVSTARGIAKQIIINNADKFSSEKFEVHMQALLKEIRYLKKQKALEIFEDAGKADIFMDLLTLVKKGDQGKEVILVSAQLAGTTGAIANANINIVDSQLKSVMISKAISRNDLISTYCDVKTILKHGVTYL